jgi:peptidoglycan hydrolase-like protein with peptidoglycan-binding domain
MKHFVNIVIENDGINENRDIAVDAVMQTANIGLNENALEYEMYESENNTQVLSIPISKNLNEAQQAFFAKRLANKLFDKGYTKFDIEFSVNESTLNEAAPTTFTPTHYGGLGGANNVMLHTDGNLYFNGPEGITRWNGNPSGEGIIGRWNPATIKGTIVNGQKVPYPSGTNFNNAPRAAAPTPTAAGNAPAAGNGTLRNGSRGEAVRKLQLDLGVQPADGVFGPSTEAAVKDFQQRMMPGETADGIVGPKTNTAIQQSAAIDTGDNPEIEKSDPNSQFAALSGFATSRKGGIANNPSQVDAIKELQAELERRGYYKGAIDGKYGPGTREAVKAFQSKFDLFVDGDAGPKTIQALMQRDGSITQTTLDDPQDQDASGQDGRNTAAGAIGPVGANAVDAEKTTDGGRVQQGPYQEGNEITDELQGQMEQAGITDLGMVGETITQEDAIALNRAWQNGEIDGPDGTPKPDAATTAPAQPPAPTADDNDAPTTPGTDVQPSTNNPDGFLGGAETDNTPSVDPNADARQVVQDFDTWADKYSDKSRGRDMMPNEFVTQALDPALNELSVEKAQRLELDMEGAPATIQRIVQADVERTYGTLEEIIDAANDDTMPKDQQQALQILADMLKSLSINAPGNANENVEPMPKGVFMVEERSIWRSLYGKTHYTNGQARPRTFISESKSAIPEITFEDDDKFFENYGVMWFNEDEMIDEAEYQGRNVKLGKPMSGDVKKFKVYVKNPNGNVVKVNFGQKGARIKKDNPERRRSFRARHNCDNPGPRHKARYWSCRKW